MTVIMMITVSVIRIIDNDGNNNSDNISNSNKKRNSDLLQCAKDQITELVNGRLLVKIFPNRP